MRRNCERDRALRDLAQGGVHGLRGRDHLLLPGPGTRFISVNKTLFDTIYVVSI